MDVEKYEDILKSLVKKYNKGEWDEDLMQEAWVAAIECYNQCKNEDENIQKAKIITWVKNRLINIKLKASFAYFSFDDDILNIEDTRDYGIALIELRDSLNEEENKVLDKLLEGYSPKEIKEFSKSKVYRIMDKIKGILKG